MQRSVDFIAEFRARTFSEVTSTGNLLNFPINVCPLELASENCRRLQGDYRCKEHQAILKIGDGSEPEIVRGNRNHPERECEDEKRNTCPARTG